MTTSRAARACLLAMTLLSSALTLGATTPYSFDCNLSSGISANPNEHRRVGYITILEGMGLPRGSIRPDLTVTSPYQGSPAYVGSPAAGGKLPSTGKPAAVVGIIEKFEWEGGVGHPLKIDFYVSQENAFQLKALAQQTLKTLKIDDLGWWIVDYDQETKTWYEQAYPASSRTISGIITGKENPGLTVNVTPVAQKNARLYKVSLSVTPGANKQYALRVANSPKLAVNKPWGLVVGSLANTPVGK